MLTIEEAYSFQNSTHQLNIVPKPSKVKKGEGGFVIDPEVKIQAGKNLENERNFLKEILTRSIDLDFSKGNRLIQLKISDRFDNDEAYHLQVSKDHIDIEASTNAGIFYGIQTLRQLLIQNNKEFSFPVVEIEDSPALGYRGMHLDVARHFFDVNEVKEYLDMLALHKINTFHWHLTEDQGWRIEIKKYPKLTEIGGFRNGTIVGRFPGSENDNEKYGGFYTQEEIREVIKYAEKRHITIIPEIEMPGHSSAAIAAYPYLSCFPEENTIVPEGRISESGKHLQESGNPKIVQESWGVFDDVFCAGKESTFTFLENVLDEVVTLFPSEYIHIGGDECPKANWERCPDCQKRITDLGLEDEHELQSYFIQRMEKYLNAKGKKIIGWDEILEGGLAPNATVMSWRGEEGGIEAAKQKHDVIMTPTGYFYLDYYQEIGLEGDPMAIGAYLPLSKVYSYNPKPEELSSEEAEYILGVQANVWTEYMQNFDKVQYMTLPRLAALAEVGWTRKKDRNWLDFVKRVQGLKYIYEAQDYNYAGRKNSEILIE
ncbi:beta-N-acetylhexosaminidase [Gramella lutea]|uniref:beta-N-acetylhexosaminidase n=1 Tax=Christiangramia lutea TaxID=1607951 RepID=A0A9X1V5E9_9FLAO|nr:beta-N-acetylhexosaminidase [Christiangramia lutea]MCH4824150.1 beta-N-acetylhexosaminidase [Christiangramia lutea]